jgi:bis(5'-nucleosyl)-tetraphosphatase (symmetrical)
MTQKFNYIIGDIHGCYDELVKLEEKIKEHSIKNKISPFIISVGDLIDRGNKSKDVLEYFINGSKNKTHLALMGNHELLMIQAIKEFASSNFDDIYYPDWLYSYQKNFKEKRGVSILTSWDSYRLSTKNVWLNQGGKTTLESFNCNSFDCSTWKISKEIIEYLINLDFYYESDNFIVTHALPYPEDLELFKSIPKENYDSIEFRNAGHSMVWNRIMPESIICENKIHISGHTPLEKAHKSTKANAIQIDTSCVFGGKLTAYCVETNELISVKANKTYFQI